MLYLIIALAAIAAVMWLIYKRFMPPQPSSVSASSSS